MVHTVFKKSSLVFITVLILASCATPAAPSVPSTGVQPGPPPTANGQAILGWGGNTSGQLGDGTNFQRLAPVTVNMKDVRSIAAGGDYSLAVMADGRVLEWGGGTKTPTQVAGLGPVKQIAAGARHRLALLEDGTVWAWGDNNHGQLGDGTNTARPTPVQVPGLNNVRAIFAGGEHSLAIMNDLTLQAWGANNEGQLGDGTTIDRLKPYTVKIIEAVKVNDEVREISRDLKVIDAAAAAGHTVVLTSDVKVMGWGSNKECQLGPDHPVAPGTIIFDAPCSDQLTPKVIYDPSAAHGLQIRTTGNTIAATDAMTLIVIAGTGDVLAVGGRGDPDGEKVRGICNQNANYGPALIPDLRGIEKVFAGSDHALFLDILGNVWALGANNTGQLGLGATSDEECAHRIDDKLVRRATMIAAGKEQSLALVKGWLGYSSNFLDFGAWTYGMGVHPRANMTITLENNGYAPITFYGFSLTSQGDYSMEKDCPDQPATLAPNASCKITVRFDPVAPGKRDGEIVVVDDSYWTTEFPLTGKGVAGSVTFSPTTIDFGTQTVGTTSPAQMVSIQNTGDGPLFIDTIEATANFAVSNTTCVLGINVGMDVQGTCTVVVAFTPTVTGAAVGELRVTYEPHGQVARMPLEGTGN